jgi:hypothetical protein
MAVLTDSGAIDVIGRLRRCLHRTDCRVTICARRTCSLKLPTGMAAFTGYIGMGTFKIKSGTKVIKWLLRLRDRHTQDEQQDSKHFPNRFDH